MADAFFTQELNDLLKRHNGIFKTADAVEVGVTKAYLSKLVDEGRLERVTHGQYGLPNVAVDELYLLHQRSRKYIFSHETALFLHGFTDDEPFQHSVTIPSNRCPPEDLIEGYKIYYIKPELHGIGTSRITTEFGNEVYVYDLERTICDVVRSRNRVEEDLVSDAVKQYMAMENANFEKLYQCAEAFRMTKALRLYIETLS